MNNVKFSVLLVFLLSSFIVNHVVSQTTVQAGTDYALSISGSQSTYWELDDANGNPLPNPGNYATIRINDGTCCSFFSWSSTPYHANSVVVSFNCAQAGKSFSIYYETYNYIGTLVNFGSYPFNVIQATTATVGPKAVIANTNADCSSNLCVTNALNGATYSWSNGTSGACTTFAPNITGTVTVKAFCGNTYGLGSISIPTPPSPSATINGSGYGQAQVCASSSLRLLGASPGCIPNPNWHWTTSFGYLSPSGPNIVYFYPQGQLGNAVITLSVTDVIGRTSNVNYFVTVNCRQKTGKKPNTDIANTNTDNKEGTVTTTGNEEETADTSTSQFEANNTSELNSGIFPNPVANTMRLENMDDVKMVRLYNLSGQLMAQQVMPDNEVSMQVDVSKFANGMYLVAMQKGDGSVESQKIRILR